MEPSHTPAAAQQDKWFNGVQEQLTTPLITRLDLDPFERFHEARGFDEWQENRSWALGPADMILARFFGTFEDYPPRQASFDLDAEAIMDAMMDPSARCASFTCSINSRIE